MTLPITQDSKRSSYDGRTSPIGRPKKISRSNIVDEASTRPQTRLRELFVLPGRGDYDALRAFCSAVPYQVRDHINQRDSKGYTPLHYAVEGENPQIINLLLELGADINAKSKYGTTALHKAVEDNHAIIVELLIQAGAEKNIKDNIGETPLHYAMKEGFIEMVNLLIALGVNLEEKNKYGNTALHYAAENNLVDILSSLIHNGASVDALDKNHFTPLCFAIMGLNVESVRILLNANARIDLVKNSAKTPVNLLLETIEVAQFNEEISLSDCEEIFDLIQEKYPSQLALQIDNYKKKSAGLNF